MVNKNKIKGTSFENQLVKLFQEYIPRSQAKRIAGSGAIGTTMGEPLLTGDVIASFPGFPRKFRVECKVRCGGKSMTVEKEWFDKIKMEAEGSYSIPLVALKFLGSRASEGVQYLIATDFETFCGLINYVADLKKELDENYK